MSGVNVSENSIGVVLLSILLFTFLFKRFLGSRLWLTATLTFIPLLITLDVDIHEFIKLKGIWGRSWWWCWLLRGAVSEMLLWWSYWFFFACKYLWYSFLFCFGNVGYCFLSRLTRTWGTSWYGASAIKMLETESVLFK